MDEEMELCLEVIVESDGFHGAKEVTAKLIDLGFTVTSEISAEIVEYLQGIYL